MLHRLGDIGAQPRHVTLEDLAFLDLAPVRIEHAGVQFVPEAGIRPVRRLVGGRHLQVEPRNARRAPAAQGEAAVVIAVGHVGDRRRMGEHAEPGKVVGPAIGFDDALGHGRAADAVEAVAAGDEIAFEHLVDAVLPVMDARPGAVEILDARHLGFEDQRRAGFQPGGDQVLHHFELAVDHHAAAGQGRQVEMDGAAAEADVEPVVDHAFAAHAPVEAEIGERVDRAGLQHAGAHPRLDMGAAARLEHDRLDAAPRQEMGEKQARGSCSDDPDLSPHDPVPACDVR